MRRAARSLWVPLLLVLLWEAAARLGWIDALFVPAPSRLAAAAGKLVRLGVLQSHAAATLSRTLTAFFLGGLAGTAFGLLLSLRRGVRETLEPLLAAAFTIPKVTLLPLFFLLLGLGETAMLMPPMATCFIVCALHALDAATGVPRTYVELARNYGARRWTLLWRVYVPASCPRIFTGLRIAIGSGLIVTISSEMLSANSGLGGMIWMGWQTLSTENLMVGIIAVATIGYSLQTGLHRIERWLLPWSRAGAAPLLVLLIALAVSPAQAQTTGSIAGMVEDPSGRGIPGATVVLTEAETRGRRETIADGQGRYFVTGLAPGLYSLEANGAGFQARQMDGLELTAGKSVRADVRLQVGEVRETVKVVAATPLVSASASDWGTSIGKQKLENLPLNGRDLFDLAAQEAGSFVTTNTRNDLGLGAGLHLSVNAMRPNQNSFRMDGIYINDASGSAPSSAAGRLLGIESVQELRLVTSPFSAEYGRAAGSVITAVSKSGGNAWHGAAYEFLRNSAMDAKNYFDAGGAAIPPFRRNQFGGLFSGPVRRDRVFFLVNYEGLRQNSSQTTIATTLTEAGRLGQLGATQVNVAAAVKPFLAAYPLPNGRRFADGTGEFVSANRARTREDFGAAKMDAIFNDRWRLSSRVSADAGSNSGQDLQQTVDLFSSSSYVFAHNELQFVQSPSTIHAFRAGFSRIWNGETAAPQSRIPAGLNFIPGQQMGSLTVTGLTEIGGSAYRGRPRRYLVNDFQFSHQMTHIAGRHLFLAGGSFDRVQINSQASQQGQGQYRFNSVAEFLSARPASLDLMDPRSDTVRGWRNALFTAFAQDTVRLSPRWQWMVGVRYEAHTVPGEVNNKIATLPDPLRDSAVTLGGPLYRNPSKRNFAPRTAIAWDVRGDGRTVLRVGAGIFFDLLTGRELLVAGVRMPPFYIRPSVTNPIFPDAVAALAASTAAPALAVDGLTFNPTQPYVVQTQLALQQQLGRNTFFSAGYAGGRGVHLMGYIGNIDTPVPAFDAAGVARFVAGTPRINPAFARIAMRTTQFDSYAHSLQTSLQRGFAAGFRVSVNYAFARTIDNNSSPFFNDFVNSDLVPTFRLRDNRGLSDFDVRHNFSATGSWRAPVWPRAGWVARALTQWELHGMLRARTGLPFNPRTGFDRTLIGGSSDGAQRPDYTPVGEALFGTPTQWFNPANYSLPRAGYFGTLGRNTLTGPGLAVLDVAAHKTLWAAEQHRLQLRAEAFNLGNHPNFQLPDSLALFDSAGRRLSSAGRISSTSTSSRNLQLVLRYSF